MKKTVLLTIILVIAFLLSCIYGLIEGSQKIPIQDVWNILMGKEIETSSLIIMDLRFPRIIIGTFVGLCLGMSGTILQGIMRNPLADPGIIGVSAGAALSAVIVLMLFPHLVSFLPLFTFLGGIVTVLVIYLLAWKNGASPVRIILSGVAINSFIGAITSALMILYSDRVQAILPWMSGGIGGANWSQIQMITPYLIIALILAIYSIPILKALHLGDDQAKLLGHNVERSRMILVAISALLAGISVSISGLIGFVGLVVPHMLRLLVGAKYHYLVPLSGLGGATLVVFADTVGRSWFSPIELQVGILLAIVGGPFFLYLLHKGGGSIGRNT